MFIDDVLDVKIHQKLRVVNPAKNKDVRARAPALEFAADNPASSIHLRVNLIKHFP